jgi:hypothetical protein
VSPVSNFTFTFLVSVRASELVFEILFANDEGETSSNFMGRWP